MIDVILLRIMKHRNEYMMLSPLLQKSSLSPQTAALVDDFRKYFEHFPSHEVVDLTTFMTRFVHWHPGIKDEQVREFGRILQNAMPEADEDQKATIIQEMADLDASTRLANLVEAYKEGEVEDLLLSMNNIMDKYKISRGVKAIKHIDESIKDLLKDDFNNNGLRWRLNCLHNSMRPLRGGDFGILAARPDKGKTSLVASEVSYFAPQLAPDENILWLNNEGPGRRIIPRIWQAALDLTLPEMKALDDAGKLEDQYLELMGRFDKIRVVDIHGMNNAQVEIAIESNNAKVVVYDMIDNIGGFGDAARTDLKLEYMYQWARERAVKYDAVGLATSQISSEGDGLRYPTLPMLKDSKTGKQGACDFQLMMGAVDDKNLQSMRYFGLPKNKLQRPNAPKDPQAEAVFDAARSRFRDVSIDPTEMNNG